MACVIPGFGEECGLPVTCVTPLIFQGNPAGVAALCHNALALCSHLLVPARGHGPH